MVARAVLTGAVLTVLTVCTGLPRPIAALSAAVAAAAPTAAAPTPAAGRATLAGSAATAGQATPVREVPEAVDPAATGQVGVVTAALEQFWAADLGAAWSPPRGDYLLVDTDNRPSAAQLMCAASADALRGNAFYCPGQDGIVIDASALLPVLRYSYGGGAVTASLAHEFGHLVQARVGPTAEQRRSDPKRYPNLLLEQQADCMAGAFLQAVGSGGAGLPQNQFAAGTAMQTLGPLLDFHDDAAALPAADDRHGTALQRARAVSTGVTDGARSCRAMTVASAHLDTQATPAPAGSPDAAPRFAGDAELRSAAARSLAAFGSRPVGGGDAEPAGWQAADRYGQFAKATVLALAAGAEQNRSSAGCFAGAWAADTIGSAGPGQLGSRPGDPDEAIAAVQHWPGATMADLTGFVTGYDGGLTRCQQG